jgi:hypothetical protein
MCLLHGADVARNIVLAAVAWRVEDEAIDAEFGVAGDGGAVW